jgi:hypothetical protein
MSVTALTAALRLMIKPSPTSKVPTNIKKIRILNIFERPAFVDFIVMMVTK